MAFVDTVTSADGTRIAFEAFGTGEPVILVGGALRSPVVTRSLAERLGRYVPTINYDRRGRGDSGDNPPYAVEREIEDIAALIAQAGGRASLYGHSSGAGLALRAAAHGLPIAKLVLHDAPFSATDEDRRGSTEMAKNIKSLLANDRRADALEVFLGGLGLPEEVVQQMSQDPQMLAVAHTMPYDFEIMDDTSRAAASFTDEAAGVTVPTLVLCSAMEGDWRTEIGERLVDAMPDARLQLLPSSTPIVNADELAPVLADFLG